MFSSESAPVNDKTPEELDRLPPGYYTFPMKRCESPPPGEYISGEPQTPNMTTPVSMCCVGRPVRATITLCPIGRPVRATITLYH